MRSADLQWISKPGGVALRNISEHDIVFLSEFSSGYITWNWVYGHDESDNWINLQWTPDRILATAALLDENMDQGWFGRYFRNWFTPVYGAACNFIKEMEYAGP